MKNIKFSRLFAAFAFVAVLSLTACQTQASSSPKAIEGTWISEWGEKYVIDGSDYDNYSRYDANGKYNKDAWFLYYSTNEVEIVEGDNNTGFVFGQFDDKDHIGYGAEVGQWYGFYYFDLTEKSVKIVQAYKDGGKAGCDTLEEAQKEYTIDNGYFPTASASTCVKLEE